MYRGQAIRRAKLPDANFKPMGEFVGACQCLLVDEPVQIAERVVARIEKDEAIVDEQFGHGRGKGGRPGAPGKVMALEAVEVRCGVGKGAESSPQIAESMHDFVGKQAIGDGAAVARIGGKVQRKRNSVDGESPVDGDLRQVVILRLQPEYGDDRGAGRCPQCGRGTNRRGSLVEIEERTEEQANLLSGDDGGRAAAQFVDVPVTRRAGRKTGVLRLDGRGNGCGKGTMRARNGTAPILVAAVVAAAVPG